MICSWASRVECQYSWPTHPQTGPGPHLSGGRAGCLHRYQTLKICSRLHVQGLRIRDSENLGTRQLPVRGIDNYRGWFHSNCKACMRSHVRFDSKQPASCAREPPFLATNCCLPVWKYTQSRGSKLRSIMCAAVTGLADPPRSPSGLRAVTLTFNFSFRVPSSSHRLDQHKRRLRDVWFWFWAVCRLGRM